MVTGLCCFGPEVLCVTVGIMEEVCSLHSDSEVKRQEKLEIPIAF